MRGAAEPLAKDFCFPFAVPCALQNGHNLFTAPCYPHFSDEETETRSFSDLLEGPTAHKDRQIDARQIDDR